MIRSDIVHFIDWIYIKQRIINNTLARSSGFCLHEDNQKITESTHRTRNRCTKSGFMISYNISGARSKEILCSGYIKLK